MMWLLFVLWVIVLVYNSVYSFLPAGAQAIGWVKGVAIGGTTIILIVGVREAVQKYRNYSFAYVSAKDGRILSKKNFRWKLTKSTHEGNVVFIIEERYSDASEVSVKPDTRMDGYQVYNAIDGIGIKFTCPADEIPNFKIELNK